VSLVQLQEILSVELIRTHLKICF